MSETEDQSFSLFLRIGGAGGVDRLVEEFYGRMDVLEEARAIRAMHGADLSPAKSVLKLYFTEWLGGPAVYTAERGHPRLRRRHGRFSIGPAERDAWMVCMRAALAAVVTDEPLRRHLEQKLYQLADFVRNDRDNPHDANHAPGFRQT